MKGFYFIRIFLQYEILMWSTPMKIKGETPWRSEMQKMYIHFNTIENAEFNRNNEN